MKKTWVMLASNSVVLYKSNSKEVSKEFIKDLYQRDCIAKEIFKNNTNKPVTVGNLKQVLSLEGRISSDKMLEDLLVLCQEIDNNKKTLHIPIPHSKHVTEFFAVAGSTSKKTGAIGCYGLGTLDDPTAYIGQSVHIGNRVSQHVRGKVKTTKDFLSNISINSPEAGRVTLWTVDNKTRQHL